MGAEPLDRDVAAHYVGGVRVQPVVTVGGRMIYGLQPKQEIAFHHTPLSARWREHGAPTYLGYGGAAGGAKSHTARAIAARVALQWPGSTSIIFRRTLPEIEANHIQKIHEEVPRHLYEYNGRLHRMKWVTGSYTYFGYLRRDEDKFNYQGPEYDCMIFEEATHYSFKTVNWLLANRLRATTAQSIPFAVFPSNPGNIGHFWFKRWFIDRRFDAEREENPADFAFVQAFLADNQILCRRDPKYLKKLNMLPEPWRSWLRDGDFEAGAGLFFHELDRRVHLIEPFQVPEHWPLFAGFDWGYQHPWSMGVWAADEDGTCYKLATFRGRRQTHDEIIDSLRSQAAAHDIDPLRIGYVAAGHDTFHKRGKELGYDGPTLAEKMIDDGWVVIPANTERVRGATNLREYLHWEPSEDGKSIETEPGAYFVRNPGNLSAFEVLETRVSDELNVEDVLKTDADQFGEGGDDDYDADRYALASRPPRAESLSLDRELSAFSPDVLAYEARMQRTVRDLPMQRRGDRDHPEWGGR